MNETMKQAAAIEKNPLVTLNRIHGEELNRLVCSDLEQAYARASAPVEDDGDAHGCTWSGRPAAVKGKLDWDAIPDRVMVDGPEGEDDAIDFAALCCSVSFLVAIGLEILGGIYLLHILRHAASAGFSGAELLHRLRP